MPGLAIGISPAVQLGLGGTVASQPPPAAAVLSPSTVNEGDTLEFTLSGLELDAATSVQVLDGGVSIGTVTSEPWEFTISGALAGSHSITVKVNGGVATSPATLTVTPASPTLDGPSAGYVNIGATVNFTAHIDPTGSDLIDTQTTKIEFYLGDPGAGGELVGTETTPSSGVWSAAWDTTAHAEQTANIWLKRYWTGTASQTGTVTVDTGVQLILAIVEYPWDNDAHVDYAWIADGFFITATGTNLATWAASKGGVDIVDQGCLWDATGCNGAGCVVGNGSSAYLTAHAAAAAFSGDDAPAWRMILLFKHNDGSGVGATPGEQILCLSSSTDADTRHTYGYNNAEQFNTIRIDDGGVGTTRSTTGTFGDTNWRVLVFRFTGTAWSLAINGGADEALSSANQNTGQCTFDRLTFFARNLAGTIDNFGNMSLSAILLCDSSVTESTYVNYLKTRAGL